MKTCDICGHPALIFDEVPSTNTYLRQNRLPEGTLVVARSQSAGRGRRGNSFYSRGGLYFSVSLPRSMPDEQMWAVTFMAANAVCDALEELGATPRIKWVNDVYLGEKKVCGILCEVRQDSLILGIGVNVKKADFPPEIAHIATSLEEEGVPVGADELLERMIAGFDKYFEGWDIPLALERYRSRSLLTGREIRYTENGETKYATAVGIADNGNLLCQKDGAEFTLNSGEVFAVRSAEDLSAAI